METYSESTPKAAQLSALENEKAIELIKYTFAHELAQSLRLSKVTAPMFVQRGTGVNDDLNGTERPVHFSAPSLPGHTIEVVHSLAKWKRMKLGQLEMPAGEGILTDMRAIRADEELSPLHSLYVDQWDWEKCMRPEERSLDTLKETVRAIFGAIKATEAALCASIPLFKPVLPQEITFIHTEDVQAKYPGMSSKERENKVAKAFGAVFIIGIGGELAGGEPHDGRAPDYDDWSSPTEESYKGLNGDIVVWNPVLGRAFELSSMGIRVDAAALLRQLETAGCPERAGLAFHAALLAGKLPQTLGGGIGQSRLCMFLLGKKHIGEVQPSLWPAEMLAACQEEGTNLL
jgi:aspartate--ammonia ligase